MWGLRILDLGTGFEGSGFVEFIHRLKPQTAWWFWDVELGTSWPSDLNRPKPD